MATKIQLTVESNFEEAGRRFRSFGDLTEQETKRIEKALQKMSGDAIDSFIQKNQRAGIAITATRGKLEGLKTETSGLQRQIETLIRNGMNPEDQMLQKLRTDFVANTEAIKKMEAQQEALTKGIELSKQAATAFGITLTLALVAAGKAQADYLKEVANVNTMVDMTEADFKKLDSTVERLSNTYAIQKRELTAGTYEALSAGATDLSDALNTVLISAKLGKAALVTNAESVDILTTAMNAYGRENITASHASDVFFQTIKAGKVNGQQLSRVIGESIPLFASMGIPLEQLGGGLAALTIQGVKATQATTQLNGIINAFIKPSDAMAKALDDMGYESGSALLKAEGLTGAMKFLADTTHGNKEALSQLLPNIEGVRGALGLMAQNGKVYTDTMTGFNNVAGVTDKALEKQTNGFSKNVFTVEQAVTAFTNLGMAISNKLIPPLGMIADFVYKVITAFDSLGTPIKFLIIGIPTLTLALGSFLIAMNIGSIVAAAGVALTGFTTVLGTLATAIMAHPIGALAVAIAAVGTAATVAVTSNMEKAADASGAWATATTEDMKKMMGTLQQYQDLRSKSTRISDETKTMKAMEKQIEATTGATLKWDKATQTAAITNKYGANQTVDYLKRVTDAMDKNAAKRTSLAEAEKKAAEDKAIADSKYTEKAMLAEKEAAKLREESRQKYEAGLKEASSVREQLRVSDATRGMTTLQRETFMIDEEFKKRQALLIQYYGNGTKLLASLAAERADAIAKATEDFNSKKPEQNLTERASSEAATKFAEQQQMISDLQNYYTTVADMTAGSTEAKIQALMDEQARIKELKTLSDAEKIASEEAVQKKITDIQKAAQAKALADQMVKFDLMSKTVGNAQKLFGALDQIMQNAGKKSRAFAVAQKALAMAMIAIDTGRAFVKTLADGGPYPLNIINAGVVLAAGVAQEIATATTPIPSAETGGRFEVPESNGVHRADGTTVKLNPGETADITARGEKPNAGGVTAQFILNDQVLWDSVQRGADSGVFRFSRNNLVGV